VGEKGGGGVGCKGGVGGGGRNYPSIVCTYNNETIKIKKNEKLQKARYNLLTKEIS
jgi:hypothetical protein